MSQRGPCLWRDLPQSCPAPADRYKHACCSYDGSVYVLGGRSSRSLKDLWRYSVVHNEWTELVCTGEASPEELEEHSMVAYQGFLYVFGGMLDCAYTEWKCPLWVFDVVKQKWVQWRGKTNSSQMPVNRKAHSAVVLGSNMFIYGGYVDMRGSSQEFWSLDFGTMHGSDTMAWSVPEGSQRGGSLGPGPRHSHSAVAHQDSMYLYGGLRGLREQRDFWRWNSSSNTWSSLRTTSGPSRLMGHSAVAFRDGMVLFGGGESQTSPQSGLWRYSFTSHTWEKLPALPCGSQPPPRMHHCLAGIGPSYQPPDSTDDTTPASPHTGLKHGLLDGRLRPFKNKCFPMTRAYGYLGTEGTEGTDIELETFLPNKGPGSQTPLDVSDGETRRVGTCLTFENQAFKQQWSCDDEEVELEVEEEVRDELEDAEEDSITQHLPNLLLVVGGKPLSRHAVVSMWQMTQTDS